MAEQGLIWDSSEFAQDFKRITMHDIPELRDKGMINAANELLRDADQSPPQTPFDKSDLRASKMVEMEHMRGEVIVWAGFNILYASYVHEGQVDWNWTTVHVPNPGPKFLESKLAPNRDKYMRIVANTIQSGAK